MPRTLETLPRGSDSFWILASLDATRRSGNRGTLIGRFVNLVAIGLIRFGFCPAATRDLRLQGSDASPVQHSCVTHSWIGLIQLHVVSRVVCGIMYVDYLIEPW